MHNKLLIVTLLLIFFIFDSRFFNPPYSSRQNVKLNRNKKFPRNNINSCSRIAIITHIDQCQTTRRLQEETEGSRYEKFSTTIFNYPPPSRYRHLSSAAKRKQRGSKEEREGEGKKEEDYDTGKKERS